MVNIGNLTKLGSFLEYETFRMTNYRQRGLFFRHSPSTEMTLISS